MMQTFCNWREVLYIFLLALMLVSFQFLLQENIGLNLADEGFLWYGAIRTVHGDIPLRDFQSYDPGRYYWLAAWFSILDQQGIMALRLSVALFQVIGLTLGLLTARRVVTSCWGLGLVGLLLLVWMLPRHKLFECSLTMAAIYVAVCLIEKPSSKQYFIAGLFVGLAAFMGRNHGLYTALAFFFLILFIRFKVDRVPLFKRFGVWLAGIIIGYTPMLFMLVITPGLWSGYNNFNKLILSLLREKTTNLSLSVPWPWTVNYAQLDILNGTPGFFLGVLFMLIPFFYFFATISILLSRQTAIPHRTLLIASTFVGVFYMQHAFSRADLPHLGQSIHPFLLGLVALPLAYSFHHRRVLVGCLFTFILIVTVFVAVIPFNPYLSWLRFKDQFVQYDIHGDHLWLPKDQAAYIDVVKLLVARYVNSQEDLLIVPHSPGLYPILQRKSPIWATYLILPEIETNQMKIISDLNEHRVNWIILADVPLDGRDDLRFRHTHPLVWHYFIEEFEPVKAPGLPDNQQLLHRKRLSN